MKFSFKNVMIAALLAAGVSATINVVLFFIGIFTRLIDTTLPISSAGAPLTMVPVIGTSIIPLLMAGIVYYFISRFSQKPYKVFRATALVLLFLSFASPLSIAGIPIGMAILLISMHIVAAGSILYFFSRVRL